MRTPLSNSRLLICSYLRSISALPAEAALAPSPLLGDHAVLQCERPVAMWGEAHPGSKVKITFGDRAVEVYAGTDGRWMTRFPELAAGTAGDLIFESEGERVVSRDVVVGDVWLCTGQSNMEWTVRKSEDADVVSAAANEPMIRQFKVPPGTSVEPSRTVKGSWEVCSPTTVGGFTALGYFMARDLLRTNHYPQGLINCSWGGTAIETWLSSEAVASDSSLSPLQERRDKVLAEYPAAKKRFEMAVAEWEKRKKGAEQDGIEFLEPKPNEPEGGPNSRGLSMAYNAMMHPLAPYTLRGDIWYQGEANSKRPMEYERLLKAHIHDIRSKWSDPTLPIVVIQLPSYGGDGNQSWPYLREAQAAAVADCPHTGLVVTVDLGDPKNIHPLNKREFGERTAGVVRRVALGDETSDITPRLVSATRDGAGMRVKLERGDEVDLREEGGVLGAFELAGADRVFYPARAVLEGTDLMVTSQSVPEPVALRYAWRESPRPVLFSRSGMPVAPFRSDDWEPLKP